MLKFHNFVRAYRRCNGMHRDANLLCSAVRTLLSQYGQTLCVPGTVLACALRFCLIKNG
jgi:hypothetical protein